MTPLELEAANAGGTPDAGLVESKPKRPKRTRKVVDDEDEGKSED